VSVVPPGCFINLVFRWGLNYGENLSAKDSSGISTE